MTTRPRAISSGIVMPLRRIARRQWVLTASIAVAQVLIVALLLLLAAALLLGTFNGMPARLRGAIAFSAGLAVLTAVAALLRPALRRPPLVAVARRIERHLPDIQERLSNAIQLSGASSPFEGSSALVERLIRQAESDAAALSPSDLVPVAPAVPWILCLLATVATWAIVAIFPATRHAVAMGLCRFTILGWQSPPKVMRDVTVPPAQPMPRLMSITVHYEYPPYTGLPPRSVTGLDGTVDGLVGTRAVITLRTARPLKLAASFFTIAQSQPRPLERGGADANAYGASFTVSNDSSYTMELTDSANLTVQAELPRQIVARPDQFPSIVIRSPDHEVSVRPDDTVPIQFLAADDFGVSRIDAILRIDGGEPRVARVPFDDANRKHVTGPAFDFVVDDILRARGVTNADRIACQLRVFDNREPSPQSSVSVQQVLRIDAGQSRSFQGETEQRMATGLQDVIQNAIRELDRAGPRVSRARTRDGNEPLGEWQRKELHQVAGDLAGLSSGLSRAADQAIGPVFARIAGSVKQVATGPLREAAEQASRADLDSEDWQERNDAVTKSVGGITEAREVLQELLDGGSIERLRGMSEAARDLASAAKMQRSGRWALASERLQQAFRENSSLREHAASQPAQKLEGLIQQAEQPLTEATQAAQEAERAQQESAASKSPAASRRAADALQRAASAMARAVALASAVGQPDAQVRASQPVRNVESRGTFRPFMVPGPLPAAIRDLGISAEQWARLPPLSQRDLLNAAQQSAPPAYRQMVKDYYVKVAQMQEKVVNSKQ